MARLPKIDSEGLRLAKSESAKLVSSVVRVSKREVCDMGRLYKCHVSGELRRYHEWVYRALRDDPDQPRAAKSDIADMCLRAADQLDEMLAELERLHERHGYQSTADVIAKARGGSQ